MLEKNQAIIESRFAEANFRRNVFIADVEHGTKIENILRPEFWANVAYQMQARDRVEVYCEDGSFFWELMVTFVPEKTASKPIAYAKVVLMREVDLTSAEKETIDALPKGYEVTYRGKDLKWSVLRTSDGGVIVDKQASKKEAIEAFNKQKNLLAA